MHFHTLDFTFQTWRHPSFILVSGFNNLVKGFTAVIMHLFSHILLFASDEFPRDIENAHSAEPHHFFSLFLWSHVGCQYVLFASHQQAASFKCMKQSSVCFY